MMINENRIPKVSLRGGFSDRLGIKPLNTEIQIKALDINTRSDVFFLVTKYYEKCFNEQGNANSFLLMVLKDVFHEPVHYGSIIRNTRDVFNEYIYNIINAGDYDDVLTIVEYIGGLLNDYYGEKYYKEMNDAFSKNYVGYRFIGKLITPITNDIEIEEIEIAQDIRGVSTHIEKSKEYLSNRKKPDYENSIKESITAVEYICNKITKKTSLGESLKELKNKGISIHPALEAAFIKLYGYTSDASGIRHAGSIGGPGATFEEARYMLVSCSAFINYLKTCSSKYR